jgi:predicted ATPase
MRFLSLNIKNLRAVREFNIENLGNFIIIAGQNGCGKSCVFDAIRLLKSIYGGYQANEYHQWFGEFSINMQDRESVHRLFRDPSKPIEISASIEFADIEADFIREDAEELVEPLAWQAATGQAFDYYTFSRMAIATQLRQYRPHVNRLIEQLSAEVRDALGSQSHAISLSIWPDGSFVTTDCRPAEVAFQAYRPDKLGVIEYHSASRSYTRQPLGGINLDSRAFADQRRQQALYNWQAKYQNIRTELAASYLRHLIDKESGTAGAGEAQEQDINETLKELFQTFFPDKAYEGVRPTPGGSLQFPVSLSTGEQHDIDDLSSGEKEILYGYLRLRNSIPRNSVVLLDEPELHLNPSLLQGFTDFYHRHLGLAQGNQLWLVTHSDTLLRQAVGNINYRVYHMLLPSVVEVGGNQALEVVADDDVDRVTIELVGDLASYRPHGKVVIFEGRSENGFDVSMVSRLFPDFARRVNLVSGGTKKRVRDLYKVLTEAGTQAAIKNRFFAVFDKDSDTDVITGSSTQEFSWDVYHIENYLLNTKCVLAATTTLLGANNPFKTDDEVLSALRQCAQSVVDSLVFEHIRRTVHDEFVQAIKIGASPDSESLADDLLPSISSTVERVTTVGTQLTAEELRTRIQAYRTHLEQTLANGGWLKEFPGRLILRRYAGQYCNRIDYAIFSNVVLDKMVELAEAPSGMKMVLDKVLEA